MDQFLNNKQNEIVWKLLANPADNGYVHSQDLRQLAADFPQSGLLQALYARSAREGNMSHAASSFSPKTLYVLMNAYDNLAEVSEAQIIQELNGAAYARPANIEQEEAVADTDHSDVLEAEPGSDAQAETQIVVADDEQEEVQAINNEFENEAGIEADIAVEENIEIPENENLHRPLTEIPEEDERTETPAPVFEEEITEFYESQPVKDEDDIEEATEQVTDLPAEHDDTETPEASTEEEIIEFHEIDEEPVSEIEEAPKIERIPEIKTAETDVDETGEEQSVIDEEIIGLSHPSEDIEDDVYDEIVGIESITFTPKVPKPAEEIAEPIAAENDETEEGTSELEELIPESLAGSDYFVFERSEQITEQPEAEESPVAEHPALAMPVNEFKTPGADTSYVSKYHDDKMPYTFMWWLDKTRKEHSGIYQPFKLDTTQAIKHTGDETLQQQYYENIFHVSTVEEMDQNAAGQAVEFDPHNKEDRIIKKFIAEAPHISTPTSDKLDNENKAKKSAEDQDELVTETLARIYVDQMLYHKAINTYKKLILKFPEKSRYFADQIELLERKIN